MAKRKVAYVVHGLGREGIASFMVNLVSQMDQTKYDITIVMAVDQNDIPQERERDILSFNEGSLRIIRTCDFHNIGCMVKHAKMLKQILTEYGPYDVVHSNMDSFNGINLFVSKQVGVPIRISHSHKMGGREYKGILKRTVVKVYRTLMSYLIKKNATIMLGCSTAANQYLHGQYPSTVVFNGINTRRFIETELNIDAYKKNFGISNGKKVILTVARIMPIKNPFFTIRVIYELKKLRDDFLFLWIGPVELKDRINGRDIVKDAMEQLIAEYQIQDVFQFLGKRDDVAEILQCGDVFLLPSLHEALPISAIEAQCSGCKTILSSTITKEVDIGNAIYLPISGDGAEQQWAEKISEILNAGDRQAYTLEQVSHFDASTMADRIVAFYQ